MSKPIETPRHNDQEVIIDHPAFATISLNRVSGKTRLNGSDDEHQHYIEMSIKKSYIIADTNGQRNFPDYTIVKVRLSPLQFAELFSSMDRGEGVPATLVFHSNKAGNGSVEPIEDYRVTDTHIKRIAESLVEKQNDVVYAFNEYQKALDEKATPTVKKKALAQLERAIEVSVSKANAAHSARRLRDTVDTMIADRNAAARFSLKALLAEVGIKSVNDEMSKHQITR